MPITPLAKPLIRGTAQVGQTLSGTTYSYQWNRSPGGNIAGAGDQTYIPVSADIGTTLSLTVGALDAGVLTSYDVSAATAIVIDNIPTINVAASITGTPQVGASKTATDAIWNNSVTSRVYQWKAAGANATGAGATTLTYTPVVGDIGKTLTITVTVTNTGGTSAPSTSAASAAVIAATTAFPGQPGNPVGFAAAPGYPGSLTPTLNQFNSGTPASPRVYSFLDFDGGTLGLYLDNTHHDITFFGCRFQSNNTQNVNIDCAGAINIKFSYCSMVPRVAQITSPPNAAWPSAGAGAGVVNQPNIYMMDKTKSCAYGINLSTLGQGGPFTIENCDIWGCQSFITLYGTSSGVTIDNCWMHDHPDAGPPPSNAHQNGPGYLNSAAGPSNVRITNCTIASICNGNSLSFFNSTSGNNNFVISNNYICGGSYTVILQLTNVAFTDNIFGTDIPWQYGPIYAAADYVTKFHTAGNLWARNKINIRPGTTPYPGAILQWTPGQQGHFLWPDSTLHPADFV